MDKTFGLTEKGDKIYKVSIEASRLAENANGCVIDDLTVKDIDQLGDFYSFMFTLSDNTHIRVSRNNVVELVEKTPPEKLNHPMAMFCDFYSHSRKALMKRVSEALKLNFDKLAAVKTEVTKLANSCLVSKDVVDSLAEVFKDEKTEITEVEFAEMAL